MTLQALQKQALQLPTSDRWQLVQILLESLKQETHLKSKQSNLSRLRGIAKGPDITPNTTPEEDYTNYLHQKYK